GGARQGAIAVNVRRRGFTLIEMLTTVAVLVIVLGLMVSLARDVRNRSAERVTKDLLTKLDRMMAHYVERNNQTLPPITALVEAGDAAAEPVDDPYLKAAALHNNADLARAMRAQADASDLSPSFFDAWGNPVVFMPRQHPAIGMAGGDRFFFFSPGPDGKFLTREDNLYSYEVASE
ncbi:MAG: type II secretion system GspH family protein, partial [Planctomycetota bacterium]|nr:type II secretion system GspH family protein [Planctomycetota bacterium]